MLKSLAQDILDTKLMARDDRVVVAVSGGPDSMALLHTLRSLNQSLHWSLKLHVAHLNHGIRGDESDADAGFVQAAADGLAFPCTTERCDVPSRAAERGTSLEETGRFERYAFFNRVCLRVGARVLALGHHADDNVETILHRSYAVRGYVGWPVSRACADSLPAARSA